MVKYICVGIASVILGAGLQWHSFCCAQQPMQEILCTLTSDVVFSRALYTAADLELADFLKDGALSIEHLAQKSGCDAPALGRLLRLLMTRDVFAQTAEGHYCNNANSELLQQDHPETLRPFVLHDDATRWNALGNLGHSIKTGKPAFDYLYGKNYFAYISEHPQLSQRFDEAMTIISHQEDAQLAKLIPCVGTVADIGGGKGQLLKKIHELHPQVPLVLVDLPQVVQPLKDLPAAITAVGGSFFEPITVQADTFILKRILHDWDDAQALVILKNVAAAMQQDSTLYIVDAVVDRCENRQLITSIDMLLFSIFGGKERTYAEFEKLSVQAGLKIVQVETVSPIIHLVMCKKEIL